MTDLDRLLELAEKAKHEAESGVFGASRQGELAIACDPDSIIGLIERVKLAEARVKEAENSLEWSEKIHHQRIETLESRLRAAEEVVGIARGYVEGWDATTVGIKPWPTKLRDALRHYDEAAKA